VLLGLGWQARALSIAAALLLVSCAAVCVWAWIVQQRSAKRLIREAERIGSQMRPRPVSPQKRRAI